MQSTSSFFFFFFSSIFTFLQINMNVIKLPVLEVAVVNTTERIT